MKCNHLTKQQFISTIVEIFGVFPEYSGKNKCFYIKPKDKEGFGKTFHRHFYLETLAEVSDGCFQTQINYAKYGEYLSETSYTDVLLELKQYFNAWFKHTDTVTMLCVSDKNSTDGSFVCTDDVYKVYRNFKALLRIFEKNAGGNCKALVGDEYAVMSQAITEYRDYAELRHCLPEFKEYIFGKGFLLNCGTIVSNKYVAGNREAFVTANAERDEAKRLLGTRYVRYSELNKTVEFSWAFCIARVAPDVVIRNLTRRDEFEVYLMNFLNLHDIGTVFNWHTEELTLSLVHGGSFSEKLTQLLSWKDKAGTDYLKFMDLVTKAHPTITFPIQLNTNISNNQ